MKKISFGEPWMTFVITLIVLSVFIIICVFWDVYNVYKSSKKILHLWKNKLFAEQKNAQQSWKEIASLSTKRCQSWAA